MAKSREVRFSEGGFSRFPVTEKPVYQDLRNLMGKRASYSRSLSERPKDEEFPKECHQCQRRSHKEEKSKPVALSKKTTNIRPSVFKSKDPITSINPEGQVGETSPNNYSGEQHAN